jgi:hypothetical protein
MRSYISYFALGFALVGGASVANAQAVITQQPVVQTAETVEAVRTVEPAHRTVHRQVVRRGADRITTTRTIARERIVPEQTIVAPAVAPSEYTEVVQAPGNPQPIYPAYPRPVYDVVPPPAPPEYTEVVQAPGNPQPIYPAYPRPIYDVVPPPAAVAPPAVAPIIGQPVGYAAPVSAYRFVYEPDRILVIDNATGIAVQAIPR